jgi:hypothetical protein
MVEISVVVMVFGLGVRVASTTTMFAITTPTKRLARLGRSSGSKTITKNILKPAGNGIAEMLRSSNEKLLIPMVVNVLVVVRAIFIFLRWTMSMVASLAKRRRATRCIARLVKRGSQRNIESSVITAIQLLDIMDSALTIRKLSVVMPRGIDY